ncbi:MAG: sugar phosphate isomerase/epimerase family protein [Verrucomicrobiota bacterium]|nr:sugar phosphate isomerase/epimerase [Verrucomicrobiota bacterium]MCC6820987.1 sugar phosphate isomerase/epimerase [Limisphaerales bacterium]
MPKPSAPLTARLAVCSWSLQPTSPQDLLAKLEATGVRRVQLALDPLREAPAVWGATAQLFRAAGVAIVSGMFGCVGEDYSTLDTIRVSGGIAPDATWEQNRKHALATVALAHELGLRLVTFHAGFLPHDEQDPHFAKLKQRLLQVAELFAARGIALGLETGQETAPVLLELLQKLKCPNVGVNFDPANMLLYDKGNPIAAVRTLGPWIRQVHIKDARRTKVPGAWGEEVVAGSGEVDWPAFFATLDQVGFTGDLCIEREAGDQRVADICAARQMAEKLAI